MEVGSVLKDVLQNTWGIPACGACHATSVKMDEYGVQGCRDHIDELAEELHQNAKAQKWTTLMGAAISFTDKATHAVAGNALYRSIVNSVCDYVESANAPCISVGERCGNVPWNKSLAMYECNNSAVEESYCTAAGTDKDAAQGKPNNVAICSRCDYHDIGVKK